MAVPFTTRSAPLFASAYWDKNVVALYFFSSLWDVG